MSSGERCCEIWAVMGIECTLDGGKKVRTEGSVQGIVGKHISRVDMRPIPIKPFYHFINHSNTLPLMSIRNAATADNSVGSRAVYVTPDNRGEITCCDNRGHTRSQVDPSATYPSPIEASILLLFLSGLKANLFEQIMDRMRSGDVNDILRECHYNDRLWGFTIRTAETWRTSDRDQWRDPVLALLFRMESFNWEGKDKLMNQAKQAIRLGTATSVWIWNRVMEIQERVGPAVVEQLSS